MLIKRLHGRTALHVDGGDAAAPGLRLRVIDQRYLEVTCPCGHHSRAQPAQGAVAPELGAIAVQEWRLVGPGLATLIVAHNLHFPLSRARSREFLHDWLGGPVMSDSWFAYCDYPRRLRCWAHTCGAKPKGWWKVMTPLAVPSATRYAPRWKTSWSRAPADPAVALPQAYAAPLNRLRQAALARLSHRHDKTRALEGGTPQRLGGDLPGAPPPRAAPEQQ